MGEDAEMLLLKFARMVHLLLLNTSFQKDTILLANFTQENFKHRNTNSKNQLDFFHLI